MKRNLLFAALLAVGLTNVGQANALECNEDGIYQIATAQDLMDFAALVNDEAPGVDNTSACAELTADIDLSGQTWTPIGSQNRPFKGTFNGQYHAIKNMTLQNGLGQGLFQLVGNATIMYTIIDSSCKLQTYDTSYSCTCAFVSYAQGTGTLTFLGCINYADINGMSSWNSAFLGCKINEELNVEIIYCANYGNISGGYENGVFSGWFYGNDAVYGSLNFGRIDGQQGNLTLGRGHGSLDDYKSSWDFNTDNAPNEAFIYPDYTEEMGKSGQLCYELNSYPGFTGWYQTLGEDDFPVLDPTHKQVYLAGEAYCDGSPKTTFTYSNNADDYKADSHEFEGGYCKHCGAVDPDFVERDEEGFYLIGNTEQFNWFAQATLTDGTLSARLTADLDFAGSDFLPICAGSAFFSGTLDGQFHRIKNLVAEAPQADHVALICVVMDGASICNLIIDSSCSITGNNYIGGFVGASMGIGTVHFTNLGNEANITGGKNVAGIVGVSMDGTCGFIMDNCYNTGKITGTSESAAFTGWCGSGSRISNSFNTGEVIGVDGSNSLWRNTCQYYHVWDLCEDNYCQEYTILPGFDNTMMTSGELCYMLNGDPETTVWYQTLGTDPRPVLEPTHAQVYPVGDLYCDGTPKGTITYSNTDGQYNRDEHDYRNGSCDHCGKVDPNATLEKDASGYYHIATGGDLAVFSALAQTDYTAKCKFDADIDMTGIKFNPIGNLGLPFAGEIDGQQHCIKNLVINNPEEDYQGLVGKFSGGLVIRNLILDATCSINGHSYTAGFAGGPDGTGDVLFANLGNEADVTGSGVNVAGIVGVNMHNWCKFTLRNCYNTGDISGGAESAALSGWLGENAVLVNCWNAGVISGMEAGKPLARFASIEAIDMVLSIQGQEQEGASVFAAENLVDGSLCYYLNGQTEGGTVWTQTLGEDEWPVPFDNHGKIYTTGVLLCDGSYDPDGGFAYTNTPGEGIIPDHHPYNGICDVCGLADPTWKSADEEGWYNLDNEDDLRWFSGMVKAGNAGIKGRLTADIDLSGLKWFPIGNVQTAFKGTFDGQGHYIDNIEAVGDEYVGLFGVVGDGADIKNFILTGSVTGTRYLGGIAGGSDGDGVVRFTNIGNEANVTALDQNAAGIVGVSMHGGCAFIINNCYNAGDITGARETAAFSGWMGKVESEINNCYNIGTITGYDEGKPLYRFDDTQVKDLVCTNEDSQQGTVAGLDAVGSGELAFYVNGGIGEGTHFFQTLGVDEYPVPFSDNHKTVYAVGHLHCDGSQDENMTFSNEPGEFVVEDHVYDEDGLCINCRNAWGISTADQLSAFAWNVVEYLTNNADVVLLNDIDMEGMEWMPIGYGGANLDGISSCVPFTGKFDGQGHRILNMKVDDVTRQFLGFFGCVGPGAEIRNLIIDKSCYIHGDAYCGGLIGVTYGSGLVTIENCGNEGTVVCDGATARNAGGILGCDVYSMTYYKVINCYNTGSISAGLEAAGLSGWFGGAADIYNSWNSGQITGMEEGNPFTRGAYAYTNCYEASGMTQGGVSNLDPSAVASGELCYKLNQGNTEAPVWYQALGTDEHPQLFGSSEVVFCVDGIYTNDPAGISPILAGDPATSITGTFTLQGVSTDDMQRGINIVRMSDGTVRKVLVK